MLKKPAKRTAPAKRVSTHPPKVRTAATLRLIERLRKVCVVLDTGSARQRRR